MHLAEAREDLELVALADGDAGNEDLPHAARAERSHRMPPAVPRVEVADDADAHARWGPRPRNARRPRRRRHQMRAELVVDAGVFPFAEQIEVVVGQHTAVPVRIVDLRGAAAWIRTPAGDSRGSRFVPESVASKIPAACRRVMSTGASRSETVTRSAVGRHARITTPPGSTCGPSTPNGSAWRASASAWSDRVALHCPRGLAAGMRHGGRPRIRSDSCRDRARSQPRRAARFVRTIARSVDRGDAGGVIDRAPARHARQSDHARRRSRAAIAPAAARRGSRAMSAAPAVVRNDPLEVADVLHGEPLVGDVVREHVALRRARRSANRCPARRAAGRRGRDRWSASGAVRRSAPSRGRARRGPRRCSRTGAGRRAAGDAGASVAYLHTSRRRRR